MSLRISFFAILVAVGWSSSGAAAERVSPGTKLPTFRVIRTIPLPDSLPDNYFDYASVDSTVGKLFIGAEDGVTTVDLKTNDATSRFVKARMVHAVLPLPNHRMLLTSGTNDTAILLDSSSGSILANIKTGRHPDGAQAGDHGISSGRLAAGTSGTDCVPGSPGTGTRRNQRHRARS